MVQTHLDLHSRRIIQAVPQTGANQGTGEGNFRFFSTPSAKVFELFSNSFAKGTKVVGTEFEHVETLANGTKAYSAIASKGDDGTLYVTVVNTDRENDKKLRVKVRRRRPDRQNSRSTDARG